MSGQWLRQGTPVTIILGPATDKTDGVTLESALATAMDNLTTGIKLQKAGGAKAVRNGTPTPTVYDDGDYRVTLNAVDTNTLENLRVSFYDAATLVPLWKEFTVVPAAVYDAVVLGTDQLDVSVVQWLGSPCATPTVAGVPEVDLTHVAGDQQSAADLKDFADAGYDPATNKVQGVALTDVLTTYTGNTPQTGDSFALIGAAGAGLTALASAANLAAAAGYIDTEVAAIKVKTDNLPAAPAAVGDIPSAANIATTVLTTPITESYRADGAAPTIAQGLCEVLGHLGESSISGTTKTVHGLDGSTPVMTFTLDSPTAPTSVTRAT